MAPHVVLRLSGRSYARGKRFVEVMVTFCGVVEDLGLELLELFQPLARMIDSVIRPEYNGLSPANWHSVWGTGVNLDELRFMRRSRYLRLQVPMPMVTVVFRMESRVRMASIELMSF